MSGSEVFFDTNVLLYTVGEDTAKAVISDTVLRRGGVVSVQVLNEFTAVAKRKRRSSFADIRTVLAEFRLFLEVVPLTVETHERGLAVAERFSLNIYDALILAAAALAGCRVVYSEDMQDGLMAEGVRVENPYRLS